MVSVVGGVLTVKGPLGELARPVHSLVSVSVADGIAKVTPERKNNKLAHSLWGTYASHLLNMIEGVTKGFQKKLIIEGVGFRAEMSGDNIKFSLGFSHPINVSIPKELKVTIEKNVLTIAGIDKEAVGLFASQVVSLKRPEPYKGKGIRYEGQVVRRKQGKKTVG